MKKINFNVPIILYKIIIFIFILIPIILIVQVGFEKIGVIIGLCLMLIFSILISKLYLIQTTNEKIFLVNLLKNKEYLKTDFKEITAPYGNFNIFKITFNDGNDFIFGLSNSKIILNTDIENSIKELKYKILN